jgi:hypothetical protein
MTLEKDKENSRHRSNKYILGQDDQILTLNITLESIKIIAEEQIYNKPSTLKLNYIYFSFSSQLILVAVIRSINRYL